MGYGLEFYGGWGPLEFYGGPYNSKDGGLPTILKAGPTLQ